VEGGVTISGSLQTGAQPWQGIKRLYFGLDEKSNPYVEVWDRTKPSPAAYRTLATGL
jgi:hypothetical protein